MISDLWLLIVEHWLLIVGYWLLVMACWLLIIILCVVGLDNECILNLSMLILIVIIFFLAMYKNDKQQQKGARDQHRYCYVKHFQSGFPTISYRLVHQIRNSAYHVWRIIRRGNNWHPFYHKLWSNTSICCLLELIILSKQNHWKYFHHFQLICSLSDINYFCILRHILERG